jgi:tetracycline 7-halogenase / FADH2 O2-dependent halogenase
MVKKVTTNNTRPAPAAKYDVAILGAGIAGSLLAAALARNGVQVLLIDASPHPRFAIGESTIPYTSAMMRVIADRYQVPEIKHLASFKGIRDNVSRNCGRKQNFGFVYHREGLPQNPAEINQLVVPVALRTETHLFRQDTDAYMFNVAVRYGATPCVGVRIAEAEVDPDQGVRLRTANNEEFFTNYVVDASGFRSPLAEQFNLREKPTRARLHSRCNFTHMVGVEPFDSTPAAKLHNQPNPWHHGTLHHVFDGGWLWVIPFDNHEHSLNPLCSVGLTLDPRKYPKNGVDPQQEFRDFLKRFPDIAPQFRNATPVRPWVSTDRLQYSSRQVVGDRFCLTSHAAGFIDALYSRGLTNTLEVVNALAWRLIQSSRDGKWDTERFRYVEDLQQGLFDVHDDLAYSSFTAFRDYDLWNATYRVWEIGTVLGTLVVENAYFAFQRTGSDGIFKDLETTKHTGSPLPVSDSFNELSHRTRDLACAVEDGTVQPKDAAREIFQHIRDADYIPPSFNLSSPDDRFFHANPPKMLRAVGWSRNDAPPEMGGLIRGAITGFARNRVLGRG